MWYYKEEKQYAEQIEKQLDGKVDPKLQAEVDKVKSKRWKGNNMLDQQSIDANQKVDFTTDHEMGESNQKLINQKLNLMIQSLQDPSKSFKSKNEKCPEPTFF